MSNNDNKDYEDVCYICHKPESIAGRMFHLPNNIAVCDDCLHNTMDTMNRMGFGNIDPSIFMNMSNTPFFNNMDGRDNKSSDSASSANSNFSSENSENAGLNDEKLDDGSITGADIEKDSGIDSDRKTIIKSDDSDDNGDDNGNDEEKKSSRKQGPQGFNGIPNISFLNMSDLQGMLSPRTKVKKKKTGESTPVINIKDIPQPHKLKEMLDEYVVGQDRAKKIISVGVYNHYKRVASEGMKPEMFEERLKGVEIEKSNMLLIGPTGCGKTYLVKTLASLLNVPLAIADATSLTEAGYIGDDIESVVSKLLAAADNDVEKAETGIIFVDEIDKIAKKKNTHARDVSGESVQQGMLKLLEGADVEVPVGANSKNAMVPLTTVNTRNILFICGGAFPELDEIIKQRLRKQTSIGFNAELKDALDKRKDILSEVTVEDIKKFGMIPEFVGRLPIIFTMQGLSEDMMVDILKEPKNAIIKQYQKLLSMDEVKLDFTDEALREIAKKAMEKDTGARALRSIIEEIMLDIMYEIPKDDNIGKVTITKEYILGTGGPMIELRGTALIEAKE